MLVLAGLIGIIILAVLYGTMTRTESFAFPVTAIKHRSQWWLVSGELYPRIDRALLPATGT